MNMAPNNAQAETSGGLPQKLAERQLVDEIYLNRPWKKRQLIIIFVCTMCAFFVLNFPLKQTINSLVSSQIGKLPGRPFQYSSLDVSLFFFPSLSFSGAAISPQVLGLPLAPRLSKLVLSLRRPSFIPPGILAHVKIEEGDSVVNLYPTLSPFSTQLDIEDTVITEALLSQFLQGQLLVKGHIRVEGDLNIAKQVVQKGQIEISSEDLVLPSQRVAILELPTMEMRTFKLLGTFDQGKLNISQFQLGQSKSPVEVGGQGSINLNLRNLMASGLDMKLSVRFSPEFLENFAIIKLALGGALPENGRYRFVLGGQLGAPTFRPE